MVKVLKDLFEEDQTPPLYPLILSNVVFYICVYTENFICLARGSETLNFGRPAVEQNPHFGTPKFCQILFHFVFK